MNARKMLITLAPTILLAAAPSRGAGNDQAASVTLQPGQWETVDVFTTADISGVPDEAAAQLRSQLNRPATSRTCITPEMAADPARNLREGMAAARNASGGNEECSFSENTYSDGVIRIRATCGAVQLSMDGSFTATTADMRLSTVAQGPAAAGAPRLMLRLEGTSTARRVGDCPR